SRASVRPARPSWSTTTPAKNGCRSNRVSRASVESTSTTTRATTRSAWWESNCRTS
ncbi:hypothetical protein M9458_041108, partial [Cirrhinus mrigala]